MAKEPEDFVTEAATDAEWGRLALLEDCLDPYTLQRLDRLNIGSGSRCAEVGAGRGSIAHWLSAKVGAEGAVVAADIDCRFLTGLPENVEVRNLDIRCKDLEPGVYDVVHCRALLIHIPEPMTVVRRMAAALRPDGILIAEEADYGLFSFSGHRDARWATEQLHRRLNRMKSAKIMDAYLGRRLSALLTDADLELMGGEVCGTVARFGDPMFEFQRLTYESSGFALVAAGLLSEEEHTRFMEMMQSPMTSFTSAACVGSWARRTS